MPAIGTIEQTSTRKWAFNWRLDRIQGVTVIVQGSTLRAAIVAIAGSTILSGCVALRRNTDKVSAHEKGSKAWWAERANDPIGGRQKLHHGKLYPPFARPTGPEQQLSHTFHAAHYWPHPYCEQDRVFVENIYNDQIANGWNDATTVYEYHFDPTTHELTQPGQNHIRWMMEQAPPSRRVAYVQSTYDNAIDQVHLAAVRLAVNHFTGNGTTIPPVVLRHCSPNGRPAEEIQAIRTAELNAIVAPTISGAIQGAGGGGGGGGGGGAAGP